MQDRNEFETLELEVGGMTCDSCAARVEQALRGVENVAEANVPGWRSGRALVSVRGAIKVEELTRAIRAAGYEAALRERQPEAEKNSNQPTEGDGDFDLMVIGHGSAGFAAAIHGAELGYRVALAGEGEIGGTCVNWGCVPSKTLILAMEQYQRAGEHPFAGVDTTRASLSWPQVIDQKDELVGEMRQSKYIDVLHAYPAITHIQGRGRLTAGGGVEVGSRAYAPRRVVVATGARPWSPPIPGLDEVDYLDSTSAMELRSLPKSMIVLGGNAVGLELAQTFSRAGVHVTVLELMPHIAPFEDQQVSNALAQYLKEEGLQIATGIRTTRVDKRDGRYRLTGEQGGGEVWFEADSLLVAAGRRPNTEGLGVEAAGVNLGKQGEILVDEHLRTSSPGIYAAGDVLGRDMFVYVAAYGGKLAASNALNGTGETYDASYIPRVTFTDPQIASAGLTEAEAVDQGYEVKTSALGMEYVPRALAARDMRGLIKLVAEAQNDRLLGAHILAPEAGEVIQTAALAMRFGLKISELRETMFPYLTNVEGLKLALLAFEKDLAKLSCCAN